MNGPSWITQRKIKKKLYVSQFFWRCRSLFRVFYDCFSDFFFADFLRNLCDCANHFDGGHLLFAVLAAPIFTREIKTIYIYFSASLIIFFFSLLLLNDASAQINSAMCEPLCKSDDSMSREKRRYKCFHVVYVLLWLVNWFFVSREPGGFCVAIHELKTMCLPYAILGVDIYNFFIDLVYFFFLLFGFINT